MDVVIFPAVCLDCSDASNQVYHVLHPFVVLHALLSPILFGKSTGIHLHQ